MELKQIQNVTLFSEIQTSTTTFIAYLTRNSIRLSVRPSVTQVDQSKTVEDRIMQFSPYSSPIPLVFVRQVSSRNSDGFPLNGDVKQGWVRKISHFSQ